jgi:hypothetical protein
MDTLQTYFTARQMAHRRFQDEAIITLRQPLPPSSFTGFTSFNPSYLAYRRSLEERDINHRRVQEEQEINRRRLQEEKDINVKHPLPQVIIDEIPLSVTYDNLQKEHARQQSQPESVTEINATATQIAHRRLQEAIHTQQPRPGHHHTNWARRLENIENYARDAELEQEQQNRTAYRDLHGLYREEVAGQLEVRAACFEGMRRGRTRYIERLLQQFASQQDQLNEIGYENERLQQLVFTQENGLNEQDYEIEGLQQFVITQGYELNEKDYQIERLQQMIATQQNELNGKARENERLQRDNNSLQRQLAEQTAQGKLVNNELNNTVNMDQKATNQGPQVRKDRRLSPAEEYLKLRDEWTSDGEAGYAVYMRQKTLHMQTVTVGNLQQKIKERKSAHRKEKKIEEQSEVEEASFRQGEQVGEAELLYDGDSEPSNSVSSKSYSIDSGAAVSTAVSLNDSFTTNLTVPEIKDTRVEVSNNEDKIPMRYRSKRPAGEDRKPHQTRYASRLIMKLSDIVSYPDST